MNVMITGASSGIGKATAIEMGRRGFHVIAAGRSEERTMPVVDEIHRDGGGAEFLMADLASLQSAREAAERFAGTGRELDVLINNAGVGGVWGMTGDGFEINFGVNHLGHFMLTHHLRPAFRPGTRIVVVASHAHYRVEGIDFDRLQNRSHPWNSFKAYSTSKLANVLFARHLASMQSEWNVYAVHPGVVNTNIFPRPIAWMFRPKLTPEQGAQTSLWCATSDDVANESGNYYSNKSPRDPSPTAQNPDLAQTLWTASERWCHL